MCMYTTYAVAYIRGHNASFEFIVRNWDREEGEMPDYPEGSFCFPIFSNICHTVAFDVLWLTVLDLSPLDHLPENQRCQEGGRGAPAPEERGDAEHPCGPPRAETLPEIQTAKGDA